MTGYAGEPGILRHSGAERSEEPGIHTPQRRGYGFRARRFAAPRNDEGLVCGRPGMTKPPYPAAERISRSAAALASSVISAPASILAISSRRLSAGSSATLVATRRPLSRASLLIR